MQRSKRKGKVILCKCVLGQRGLDPSKKSCVKWKVIFKDGWKGYGKGKSVRNETDDLKITKCTQCTCAGGSSRKLTASRKNE